MRTERLVMRRWQDGDREPFAAMNADPEVMEHFPAPLTRAESDALIASFETRFEEDGFGFWALETAGTGEFVGFTGLSAVRFQAPFVPAVEIGWRLVRSAWGHGYASEAARRALRFAFEDGIDEVVSFTAAANTRSRAVMERIGMTRDPADDFDRPLVPDGHRLKRHVLYRTTTAKHAG
ncbi:GNAT family N-acetyltransferase [Actinomadura sp. 7K534]|uniref:GNAT family N-acetyltransferase n=1 Tax=Actinomadura sp. 7K534 TaxID=2530366 RepID=UPI001FB69B87|nr:GNAT family N-acetyltransferase [Actinomadura sp. 7K534]